MAGDGGLQWKSTVHSGGWPGRLRAVGDILYLNLKGKFQERLDMTIGFPLFPSLILTCRTTLENDLRGR